MNILIFTSGIVGKKIAGPVARHFSLASELSSRHNVTLMGYDIVNNFKGGCGYSVAKYSPFGLFKALKRHDCLIAFDFRSWLMFLLAFIPILKIFDLYDFIFFEDNKQNRKCILGKIKYIFSVGDMFLCATSKQADFCKGLLYAQGRFHQETPSVIEIPFGLPPTVPPKDKDFSLKEKFGIAQDDPLLIWGGGLWKWFDIPTLLKAMKLVKHVIPNIRLFFLGGVNDAEGKRVERADEIESLAIDLGLINENVFFNKEWVDFNERHNYLLSADIGINTHPTGLETTYAFRTRILDYLWAQLPIITNDGDYFGQLVEQKKLGIVVPAGNEKKLSEAIIRLVSDKKFYNSCRDNISQIKEQFFWPVIVDKLHKVIEDVYSQGRFKTTTSKKYLDLFVFCTRLIIAKLSF